jgi:flagellar biosynthetic protein FliR
MPVNLTLSLGTLYAFLLVLTRVGGAFVFVPLPGLQSAPMPARAAFALAFTLALAGRWPAIDAAAVSPAQLAAWVAAEAASGIAIGVALSVTLEAFTMAAQVCGLQAGYGYASTIDPNTQADAGILLVFAQLMAGLLFFAVGLDREVLRLFALSLDKVPLGAYVLGPAAAQSMIRLGSSLFSVGLRLAFPVVALLVMMDVALALLGRVNQQLQLIHLAFPAKMLVALLVLSWTAMRLPRMVHEMGGLAINASLRMLGI